MFNFFYQDKVIHRNAFLTDLTHQENLLPKINLTTNRHGF